MRFYKSLRRLNVWLMSLGLLSLFAFFVVFESSKDVNAQSIKELCGSGLGTTYDIKYLGSAEPEEVKQEVEAMFEQMNKELSNWNKNSWVSEFNRAKAGVVFKVSPVILEVLKLCMDLNEKSDGAFDITVSPLLELWGFGDNTRKKIPSPEELALALSKVGTVWLDFDPAKGTLSKKLDGVQINTSALAKGYIVDQVLARLKTQFAIKNAIVDIGGEISACGAPPKQMNWLIGLGEPLFDQKRAGILQKIPLFNSSVATSGDYEDYFVANEKVYQHIFDPKTGMPVEHDLCSVTITHPLCAVADGLATACLVLGEKKARELLKAYPESEGYFVHRLESGAFKESMTEGFKKLP